MSEPHRFRRFLRLPWRSAARIRHDVDEELRLHIELRAQELERQGLTPADARAQALRTFGDVEDAARYCAGVDRDAQRRSRVSGWLEELRQDVSHTFRLLRRGPAFAAATVLTLGAAIGASTAAYGVLRAFLVRPLPFPAAERLVFVNPPPADRASAVEGPSLDDVDWTSIDSLFDLTVAWDLDGFSVRGQPYAENVVGAWVTPGFFPAMGVTPAVGRAFTPDEYREQAPVAIISHALWQRRFGGDPGIVGRTITAHSTDRPTAPTLVTIVGVTPREFWPIHWRESDLLRPLTPDARYMPALARLAPGRSLSATEERLDALVRAQVTGPINPAWRMRLVPAREQHAARARTQMTAMGGAVLFMLLAACGSVAGALMSRVAARRAELAVRIALGGSRRRVVRQLLTESAVFAVLAGSLGLVLAWALLSASGELVEGQLGTRIPGGVEALHLDAPLAFMAIVASALIGLVLGVLPTFAFLAQQRGTGTFAALVGGRTNVARGGAGRARRVLIAGQVALAMVLLFGAGLMFRTVARMAATDLGFREEGLLTATVLFPGERYPDSTTKRLMMGRLLSGIAATPGVQGVATVSPRPFGGGVYRLPVLAEGGATDEEAAPRSVLFTVSPEYFATMDVPLVAGRTLGARDDARAPLAVVISESLARAIAPGGDAVGRRLRVRVPYLASFDDPDDRPWRTIVGVVRDTRHGFTEDRPFVVYVPYAQNPRSLQSLVVRTERDEATMVEPVRRAVAALDPELALSAVASMTEVIDATGGARRGLTILLGACALFALALSALALFASLSYTVTQRRAELAVRMAVGASARSILALVVSEGLRTAAAGAVLGAVASLWLGKVLANQVYGVATDDPVTLLSISAVLGAVVALACLVPALRASRTEPVLALRE